MEETHFDISLAHNDTKALCTRTHFPFNISYCDTLFMLVYMGNCGTFHAYKVICRITNVLAFLW